MYERHINETVNYIKDRCQLPIDVAIILGSGWSPLAAMIEDPIVFPYHRVPHFCSSTIEGHESELIIGRLQHKIVLVMSGRIHYYEGHEMDTVTFPIRVMAKLGIKTVIITNVCGGIRSDLNRGDLVVINDHISLFAPSPLRGENLNQLGPRFPSMVDIYTPSLRQRLLDVANEQGIRLKEGVYCFYPGPQYETPADIRALRALGADLCGMSTVPEATAAAHAGMNLLGLSLVTNKAAGLSSHDFSHESVLTQAEESSQQAARLLTLFIQSL